MLDCYVLTLSDLHVWYLTLAIHEMTALIEITAKIYHLVLTCNSLIVLRKWAQRCMLLQRRCFENIRKFLEILATAMESISREGSFLKLVMSFEEELCHNRFLYCDINQFKTFNFSSPFIDEERFLIFSFSILWSGKIFCFALNFGNEERSFAA